MKVHSWATDRSRGGGWGREQGEKVSGSGRKREEARREEAGGSERGGRSQDGVEGAS